MMDGPKDSMQSPRSQVETFLLGRVRNVRTLRALLWPVPAPAGSSAGPACCCCAVAPDAPASVPCVRSPFSETLDHCRQTLTDVLEALERAEHGHLIMLHVLPTHHNQIQPCDSRRL